MIYRDSTHGFAILGPIGVAFLPTRFLTLQVFA